LKLSINLGAYGWRYEHWLTSFYPDDLPVDDEDWRLTYYSNEFNAVLVPVDYWQAGSVNDCENWLDSVHSGFQFFVECDGAMFERISPADLTRALEMLAPQLSAMVFLDKSPLIPDEIKRQFIMLAESLEIEALGLEAGSAEPSSAMKIWRPNEAIGGDESGGQHAISHELSKSSNFAFIEDELSDLRLARVMVEQFAMNIGENTSSKEATIIVNHPQLQAGNLRKFRSVLDIMGY
jgi:hypothetical protein